MKEGGHITNGMLSVGCDERHITNGTWKMRGTMKEGGHITMITNGTLSVVENEGYDESIL